MTAERDSTMSLDEALEALFKEWFNEPEGIWAVNLSKRRCAEQLRKVLDDPNYSIQIHLASQEDANLSRENLCVDEGCPHHGEIHVCSNFRKVSVPDEIDLTSAPSGWPNAESACYAAGWNAYREALLASQDEVK